MPNTLLTHTRITREALRLLHQKLNFIGNTNRQYDGEFAQRGNKIGQSLQIRLPESFTAATGRVITPQDSIERNVVLPASTQYNVPMQFTSAELGMSVDDFTKRKLDPAMSVLAAKIEGDMLADVYKSVPALVGTATSGGSPVNSLNIVLQARKRLMDALAPSNDRCFVMSTQHNLDLVDALKGLFQASGAIADQYKDGAMGRAAGFDFYENTLLPRHTPGTPTGTPLSNGVGQTTTATGWASSGSVITDGWSNSTLVLKAGDVITFAGVFDVHPETKAALPNLKQFVVTADATSNGSGQVTLSVVPAVISGGPYQNVSNTIADNQTISIVGSPTSVTSYGQSLAFQKDAFVFATGKLEMPRGVHDSAQEEFDGISMRMVSDYDVTNDLFITRLDVLCGWVVARPELAVRIAGN